MVIPAPDRRRGQAAAGIQAIPVFWIPAGAGMTFHLYLHGRLATCKMPDTLQGDAWNREGRSEGQQDCIDPV